MRRQTSKLGVLLIAAMLLTAGCNGPDPSTPYPSDDLLIRQFQARAADFARLAGGESDPAALQALAIQRVQSLADGWGYPVWVRVLLGPGHCAKGYAQLASPPEGLVSQIGPQLEQCPPQEGRIFRHISDDWYVYYESYN